MKPANVLHIPTLSRRWSDKDQVLVHAMFTLVEKFVDEEWHGLVAQREWLSKCLENDDPVVSRWAESMFPTFNTIQDIYDYWQDRKYKDDYLSEDRYEEDDEMLHKLIDVRGYLWT